MHSNMSILPQRLVGFHYADKREWSELKADIETVCGQIAPDYKYHFDCFTCVSYIDYEEINWNVNVYAHPEGGFVVELHRWSGDAFGFVKVIQAFRDQHMFPTDKVQQVVRHWSDKNTSYDETVIRSLMDQATSDFFDISEQAIVALAQMTETSSEEFVEKLMPFFPFLVRFLELKNRTMIRCTLGVLANIARYKKFQSYFTEQVKEKISSHLKSTVRQIVREAERVLHENQ